MTNTTISRTIPKRFFLGLRNHFLSYPLPHFRRYHRLTKTHCHHKTPLASLSPKLFLPFSSSPSHKFGFVGWYLRNLEAHPVVTKSVTSSLIFAAADLTSQMITSPSFSASYDLKRTSRMAIYGLIILGPSQHMWFNYLSKILPKRDVPSTLKKIFMGQALFGPVINTVFFSYNGAVQGENRPEIIARLKRDLLPTLLGGALFWPVCDFVTFKFIPVHLQPLLNSSCAYIWTIYLTYMANRHTGSDA
ncbi:PXMP2/4 family protein 4-like [Abrus precatorius]|uniref:PXMP2/4 family protein 4-like n=1 Tax=Abrus precatorius TaxID=3816 RepID=A0A8B8LWP3_ABRPR|nr:PXMP2/4 family protein 4-like [Abrus precatorius]